LTLWGRKNYQEYPWREPKEPWHGLIAEILLQRTRANNVVPVYEDFVNHFPSPSNLARASIEEVETVIYPLGLRWRAPLLKRLGEQLERIGGKIPTDLEGLRNLSGVGAYVASAWLSFHGGRRSTIVDANIVRFICRMTGRQMDGETRRKKWLVQTAESLTPKRAWKTYNYAILDFTMQICTTHPKCNLCPIGPKTCVYGRRSYRKLRAR
jgi:A/G-specific adenine glycosylase